MLTERTTPFTWWIVPGGQQQIAELFWHTARGVPGSDYPLIDYLYDNCSNYRLIDSIMESLRVEMEKRPAIENSARAARLLETILLVQLFAPSVNATFEDDCEELALFFSIDVAIPRHFTEWLRRVGGESARCVLEILGLDHSEDGSDVERDDQSDRVILGQSHVERISAETPLKRRRIATRRQSTGPAIVDERFQVELTATTLTPPQRQRVLESKSFKRKKEHATKESPIKQQSRRDTTVILSTPPKLLAIPSRSSTPGCSQRVQSLSLEDC